MSSVGSGARAQVGRLLALVPYLQNRREVPIAQVAADFGVTESRIRKDLNVLWYCGLPGLGMGDLIEIDMESVDGEGVIHLTNAEYLSRPLRLDRIEASALIVALRTLREGAPQDQRDLVDQVLAKIEAAAGETAPVDVRLPRPDGHLADLTEQLRAALASGRQVRLSYYVPSRDEQTSRVVDPIALSSAAGHLYLDAWCHQAQDQRLFRLDRVAEIEVLADPVSATDTAPRDLDDGLFRADDDSVLVTLRLQPAARWVTEYYPVESVAPASDGAIEVTLRAGDPGWLVRLVLRLGGQAVVLDPPELRDQIAAIAQRALEHYR